ncbi:hypothetical protein RHMOL_Rhmol08G0061600 [Rhododendron molle]|uniref:Uncharacterized protein n=1 Tax=Rhododendron molle TaxID=49168 RepID=A0ACC0MM87_RHOML|nr:hypothetical protein RHMOL_Rhmol08G0061600 [Rhododendron molle]
MLGPIGGYSASEDRWPLLIGSIGSTSLEARPELFVFSKGSPLSHIACLVHFQAAVVTTIGFLKDAPRVKFHGFNVYHKTRLILLKIIF